MSILYYLYHVHHWGLRDLMALQEERGGWQDLIREFSVYELEKRLEAKRR